MWILDYTWKGENFFKTGAAGGGGEMVKFEYEP